MAIAGPDSSKQLTSAHYRADVDGLRAVAVLPVILFHAGVSTIGGGFVGVDVFFVISGFVIALSLKKDLDAGRFSVAAFYERRARRILPALTVVLFATYLASLLIAPPVFFGPFAQSLSYAALFLSNLYFWRNQGYFFNDPPLFRPLLHTWSLAIEEQYYIVAPILLFLVFRFAQRRWGLALVSLILGSLALSLYATANHPLANFFSLPTRAWELLLGMLLALRPPPPLPGKAAREGLAIVGLALIAAPVLLYSERTPFPGLAALPPCLGAALLIYVGASATPPAVSKLLAWRALVLTGLISYSLYLVHWPLVVFGRFLLMRSLSGLEVAMIVAGTFAIAGLLYVVVEKPLRRAPAPRSLVFVLALGAIVGIASLGQRGSGVNFRIHEEAASSSPGPEALRTIWRAWRDGQCMITDSRLWRRDACTRTRGIGDPILLWGNSFAAHYAPGVETVPVQGQLLQYTAPGCPPILSDDRGSCREFNRNALAIIEREHIKRVVLAANWSEYDRKEIESIGGTLEELHRQGVQTVLIGQSPAFFMDPALIAARRGAARAADAFAPLAIDATGLNRMLEARSSAAGARFVDPMPHLCPHDLCPIRVAGENLYFDYGHFTLVGSARAAQAFFPYVEH